MTPHEERAAPTSKYQDGPGEKTRAPLRNSDGIERMFESKPLRFLPLIRGTNRPAIKEWQRRASADPDQWRDWREEIRGCNFGVLTGDGLGVLDIDCKMPKDSTGDYIDPWDQRGYLSFIDVEERLGIDLSNLPLVQTFSGAHLYFRYEGRLDSKVPWLPHLDVKADGGHQVAAPGTVREGTDGERTYKLLRGDLRDIPFAPEQLLRAIRQWRTPRTGVGGGSPSPGADLPSEEVAMRDGLPMGARDDFMHRLACRWWSKLGLDADAEAQVWALAYVVWEVTPGHDTFPWSHAEKCVRSAYEFVSSEYEANLTTLSSWIGTDVEKPVRRLRRRKASDFAHSRWREDRA